MNTNIKSMQQKLDNLTKREGDRKADQAKAIVSLYRPDTDLKKTPVRWQNACRGPQRKQHLLLKRLWDSHVIATQPVHWSAGCCLTTIQYCHALMQEGVVCLSVWGGPESLGIFVSSP
jgi:hypothetical protein